MSNLDNLLPLSLSFPTTKKTPSTSAKYMECLKNHAASIGGKAVDGCGEFTPSTHAPLTCGACNCHRNFHRKEEKEEEFSRFYPYEKTTSSSEQKKRYRTKFTTEQKEKMMEMAEMVGWRLQKKDEVAVSRFCKESGVSRRVFKVWMHNNKHMFAKKLA